MTDLMRHPIASFRDDWADMPTLDRVLLLAVAPVFGVAGFVVGIIVAIYLIAYWPF